MVHSAPYTRCTALRSLLGHRRKHLEGFHPNGEFVHLLEVLQNLDQYVKYVYPFKVGNTLIEGTVTVHIYMANFGSALPGVHLLYDLQTTRAHGIGLSEHSGANG